MSEAITVTPAWAAVILTAVSSTIAAAIWIGKQIFATKAEVTQAEARMHERREKSEEKTAAELGKLNAYFHRLDRKTVRLADKVDASIDEDSRVDL